MTPFAKKVYAIVSRIPLGEVRSYKWVAKKAGSPRAFRAVGQILKRNPHPLMVPCHRVVKNDGTPGGYVGGSKIKKMLLEQEKEIRRCLQRKG